MGGVIVCGVQWDCLPFLIVVFPDHTHLLVFIFEDNIFLAYSGPTEQFRIYEKLSLDAS